MERKELIEKEIKTIEERIKVSSGPLREAKEGWIKAKASGDPVAKTESKKQLDIVFNNRNQLKSDLQFLYSELNALPVKTG